ncbi:Surface immunogenic protein [Alkalibacterium sp. AK22]|uniref:LysM peptidoglycan-binding domain-containing protein n=1 Tax=Alkalibacterium sp. AK22 TaxID=1229520 RepID=UPI00044746D8|nr:LysM peptidoglycan-binding domain-containing protein [Alkalibacterium sp. AK22]EXJ22561.1 Surface immunogenic protein [Alkalibacterium sp. AK22]
MNIKIEKMSKVERKHMVKGKQWMIVSTVALALGVSAFSTTEASAAEYTPETWVARTPEQIVIQDRANYLIIWGDTLWAISEASGVSVDALVSINNIANRDLIYAGNTLVIDGQVVTVTEQNGQKSSFVVEGDNVTPTDNHVEGVQATQPAQSVTAPQASEKGGVANDELVNGGVKEGHSSKADRADATPAKPATPSKEADKVEDGGNFAPAQPETPAEEVNANVPADKPSDKADTDSKDDAPADVKDEGSIDKEDGGNFAPAVPEDDKTETPVDRVPDEQVMSKETARTTVNFDLGGGYTRQNPYAFSIPTHSAQYGLYVEGGEVFMLVTDDEGTHSRGVNVNGEEYRFADETDATGEGYVTLTIVISGSLPVVEDNSDAIAAFKAFLNANLEGEFEVTSSDEAGFDLLVGSDDGITPDWEVLQADFERVMAEANARGYETFEHNGGDFWVVNVAIR